jgi:hypothetical protein
MSAALDRANPPRANRLSRSRARPTAELINPSGGAKSSTHVYHMQIPDSQSGGYQAISPKTTHGRIDNISPAIPATFRRRMLFPLSGHVTGPIVPAADRGRAPKRERFRPRWTAPRFSHLQVTSAPTAAQPLFPDPIRDGWLLSLPQPAYDLRGFSSSAVRYDQNDCRKPTVSHDHYGPARRGGCSGSVGFSFWAALAPSSYSTSFRLTIMYRQGVAVAQGPLASAFGRLRPPPRTPRPPGVAIRWPDRQAHHPRSSPAR